MTFFIEMKKLKRTGYFPAFIAGGLLAAAFPVVNMLVRGEVFTSLAGTPITILMKSNWQMMAMLNILIAVCGACMMFHTEYADNAGDKMSVLPVSESRMFICKFLIAALSSSIMILIEGGILVGCGEYWFPDYGFHMEEMIKTIGFQIIVMLPTVMLIMVIASACRNMWVSLGIGVILVFALSVFPQDNLVLSLFPFSSPYEIFALASGDSHTELFLGVCGIEIVLFGMAEMIYLKVRRRFQ